MMGGIRACETAMQHRIGRRSHRAWTRCSAAVIRPLFRAEVSWLDAVAGRRPERWRPEDKTIIDALWDACGVPRAPYRVVSNDPDELQHAHALLNRGHGTVWAADNRDGWHGGASGLRWVRSTHDANQAIEWMGSHAHRVRMMPFLEGIPCSIRDRVRRFRGGPSPLRDGGSAIRLDEVPVRTRSNWDPPAADRAQMRAMVKTVGAHLKATVGYRGVFTIDGILRRRFPSHQANPRFGAAIGVVGGAVQNLDLYLLHLAIIERRDLDWQPRQLERVLLDIADRHRRGGAMQGLPHRITGIHGGAGTRGVVGVWLGARRTPCHSHSGPPQHSDARSDSRSFPSIRPSGRPPHPRAACSPPPRPSLEAPHSRQHDPCGLEPTARKPDLPDTEVTAPHSRRTKAALTMPLPQQPSKPGRSP